MLMRKAFAHKNPDTDATCSPIAYAWYQSEKKNVATAAYLLGEPSKEARYVLGRFGQPVPELLGSLSEGDEVAVLDTNNPEELPEDIGKATIKEIIDHHKLVGGLKSAEPIGVTIRPLACTATVLWQLMEQDGVAELPGSIAGLMCAAILSDTLKFTSPTTTDADRQAAQKLAELAGVSVDELAGEMFAAKSDLTGMSAKDLLLSDSKVFDLGGKRVRVSSLETTLPANALDMRDDLVAAMEAMKQDESLDAVFFFVVDILQSAATLMVPSGLEREVAERGFGTSFEGEFMRLPGVVSRKKQMLPALEKALAA